MIIEIVIEKDRCRHWLRNLAEALRASKQHEVRFRFEDAHIPISAAARWYLTFEKKILRISGSSGFDLLDASTLEQTSESTQDADYTIDLTAEGSPGLSGQSLQVTYDGLAGENALWRALMSSGTPIIEVRDQSTGKTLARGTASLEAANGISGAMAAVFSRVEFLIARVLSGPTENLPPSPARNHPQVSPGSVVSKALKQAVQAAIKRVYRVCFYPSHWRVGWRFCDNESVAGRMDLEGEPWTVLKSPHDHFYADPFPFEKDGRYFLFFEDLDQATQKGVISAVEMTSQGPTSTIKTVLEEPWHLSYPFVFERDGEIWMVPESSANREVVLYRSVSFPDQWERHSILLSDIEAADATIIEHEERLWMFAVVRNGTGGYSDTLNIYFADALEGPWQPHEKNPVLVDDREARPAGFMFEMDRKLWRPIQDCRNGYGAALSLATIEKLTPTEFEQMVHKTLVPDDNWPGRKFHTLNKSGSLEVIDGCTYHSKSRMLARLLERS